MFKSSAELISFIKKEGISLVDVRFIVQQVAFGFEAGYQIGRTEALSEESLRLIRQPMREWA